MAALAAFLTSDEGKTFAAVNSGIDIGSFFSDDVVAYNARAAALWLQMQDEPEPEFDQKYGHV